MEQGTAFLALRMVIYVFAVPFAAWMGGTFDPATGDLTINIDSSLNMLVGLFAAAGTFAAGRVAKSRGQAT